MDTPRYDANFIPGTINIYAFETDDAEPQKGHSGLGLKTSGKIILTPQPSDSPNDPLNWGFWKKYRNLLLLAFITGFTAATSNDAGATQDSLNEIYGISYDAMNTGAGVLFAAIGYGTWVLAPASALYGRRITYLVCTLLGLVGAIWFACAKRTSDTIWSQLFVGASEACAEAQVQLSLSDMFFSHQLGGVLTVYIMATSVGTFLGPLVAGFISADMGFRWVGWFGAIISGGLLIVLFFGLEETSFDRSLYMRRLDASNSLYSEIALPKMVDDKGAGKEKLADPSVEEESLSGSLDHRTNSHRESAGPIYGTGADEPVVSYWKSIRIITPATNLKGYGFKQYMKQLMMIPRVFTFPPVLLSGLLWGLQDCFLTFYLTTEEDTYYDAPFNYTDKAVAIMNVPTLIGAVIGCIYAGSLSDKHVLWMARRNNGVQEAEFRLWFLILPALLSPLGLLMFGIGTGNGMSWPFTYMGLVFIGVGWGCIGDISMSYLMDAYPEMVLEGMVG
ncbi:hypothetical protein BABINDRAFT_161760, partial [Babjeviella inositovora NRRL Y-12698]